jgi:hypothetical protein
MAAFLHEVRAPMRPVCLVGGDGIEPPTFWV